MAGLDDVHAVGVNQNPLVVGIRYAVLTALALLFLLPFYILIRNGFASSPELSGAEYHLIPDELHPENFSELFTTTRILFADAMINTAVASVVQTVLTLLIAALAGYGLARIPSRWAKPILGLTIGTLMIPAAITFIPSFLLASTLGWIGTYRGLVIPVMFSGFAVFLFRQYFLGFPRELEEAARVDGLGHWSTFWRIVMPNSWGFTAAIGMITFIGAWNSFLWPLVINGVDKQNYTVQRALSAFLNSQSPNYPLLYAGAAISVVPLLLLFLFLQRYIVQGVESSGIKG